MTLAEIDNNGLTYGRGYVYYLKYHIVWCTKYRKPVIYGDVKTHLIQHLRAIEAQYGFTIEEMETMTDHVHLLISCKPQISISDLMKIIKGNTARWLFMQHKELKQQLTKGHLWNPSYCVVTVSDRTEEQIRHYINTQNK